MELVRGQEVEQERGQEQELELEQEQEQELEWTSVCGQRIRGGRAMSNSLQRLREAAAKLKEQLHRDGLPVANVMVEDEAADEIERLREWISDLQSGMYVNCVYCGHRYGPKEDTPVAMADVLREHCERCSEHPLSAANQEIDRLRKLLQRVRRHWEEVVSEDTEAESRWHGTMRDLLNELADNESEQGSS